LYYGIDIVVYEIMSHEKSQKQSPWEHPGSGVQSVIKKEIKVKQKHEKMDNENTYHLFQKNILF